MNADGIDLSALSTGAAITSLLGLSGFIVACIYLIYLTRTRSEKQKLQLLPSKDRAGQMDDELLLRYGVSVRDNPHADRYRLVLKAMDYHYKKQRGRAIMATIVFLVCFAILAFHQPQLSHVNEGGERVRTEADNIVLSYQTQVEALRGDFEARYDNPGSFAKVQREGKRLAKVLSGISDASLNPSRRIIKDEYGGWALLLVARTFPAPSPEHRQERIHYAEEAVERFDSAIEKMKEVERAYSKGDRFAAEDYEWMMADPDGPWNLTNYLKAMALGVIGEAGGDATKEQVRAQLSLVSEQYRLAYPPLKVDELRWALK